MNTHTHTGHALRPQHPRLPQRVAAPRRADAQPPRRPSSPTASTRAAPSATPTSRPSTSCAACARRASSPSWSRRAGAAIEGKTEYTKHMIRMRHAGQVEARPEANEIILINSHDGASSYQMLAGVFRFVCCNGLVCRRRRQRHPHPAQGQRPGRRDRGRVPGARRLRGGRCVDRGDEGAARWTTTRSAPLRRRPWRCATASERKASRRRRSRPSNWSRRAGPKTRATASGRRSSASRRTSCAAASRAAARRAAGCARGEVAQHRPQREPEPGALGAGRGDAEAQALSSKEERRNLPAFSCRRRIEHRARHARGHPGRRAQVARIVKPFDAESEPDFHARFGRSIAPESVHDVPRLPRARTP